jgi:hypothetical protein
VTTQPPTEVRSSGATLAGAINANGIPVTHCSFEYGTTTNFGQSVPCAHPVGESSEAVQVSAAVSGLRPSTVYYVQLRASNANGTGEGATQSLETTHGSAPVVSTGQAIAGESTATLTGSVSPGGSPVTNCAFEYGATTAYGRSARCAQVLGEGSQPVPVTAQSGALLAGTVYHVRLMAVNGTGVVYGSDAVFQTAGNVASGSSWPPWQPFVQGEYPTLREYRPFPNPTPPEYAGHPPRVSAAIASCRALEEPSRNACELLVVGWRRLDAGLSVYHCAAEGTASLTNPPTTVVPGAGSAAPGRARAANTSEAGWPPDQCLKMDKGPAEQHHTIMGVPRLHNWLLGGYGSDTIIGGEQGDVIWGDYHESGWPRHQTAVIHAGNGRNVIYANDTRDYVWTGTNPRTVVHAHVTGISGVIHCQSRRIVVFLSTVSEHHFKLDGCHHVSHYSVGY